MAIVPSRSTGSFREEEDRDAGARRVFGEIREREIDTRARLPDDVRADPEAAARARKAARFTGTSPVAIERSMAEFDQRQRISSVESAMRESERMRRWFTGEGNARVSHDDVPALREVASTYDNADEGGFASWVGDQLSYLITTKVGTSGTYQADENTRDTFIAEAAKDEGFVDRMLTLLNRGNTAVEEGLLNAIAQTTGSPRARRAAEVWRGASTATIAGATTWDDVKANPFSPSTIGGYVLDAGVESLPYMATAAVPYAGVAIVATSQSGNIAADRAENNGGRRGDANIWDFITAAPYGVTSAVLERIGIEAIFAGAGRSAARRIAGAAGGEAVTEFAQGNVEYAGGTIGTDAGFDWRTSLERGFAGALAGGPFGGAIRTGVEIASAGSTRVVQYAQARASERLVDDIFTAASKSKLRLRDPDLFAEFMATQAQGTPAENLYVNGDVLRSLFQDEAGNPIEPGEGSVSWEEMLPDFWDQLAQADQTGGDVVIPMARAAAYLAGTPEWEIIKGASRVAPGGLSPNEAGSLEADWADVIEDMGRRAYAEARADVEAEGPRARVYNEVLSQARQAGFSLNASRAYADLWSERYQARAERLGGGTNAWQLFEESVEGIRQAMPGRVETYRRGDNMDVLINAMRGSAQPMMPEGEGLIDRLIRGGGVVDVNLETGKGGDIKAMGGDKVRKGGAFGRPLQTLIAQPDAAGEYDRSLTLDEWALNLWEEGYFGPREERPSVNELLDLIGDALRGEVIVPFDNRNSAAVETNNAIVQAADDLRRILEDAGLDPETATREEIDAALAAYQASEEAGAFGFDQAPLPATIEIDGIERSTVNSEGQPLARDEAGVRAFWAWFGESKVVDDEGRPLVVYYGGRIDEVRDPDAAFRAPVNFFSPDREFAAGYGRGGTLTAVYVRAENPFRPEVDADAEWIQEFIDYWREEDGWIDRQTGEDLADYQVRDLIAETRLYGFSDGNMGRERWDDFLGWAREHHDGFMGFDPTDGADIVVSFARESVKSVNNRGSFNPADPRVLFQSRRGDGRQADLFSSDPAFDPPAAAPASKPVAQPLVRDDAPGRYATRTEVVQENVREIGAARVTTVEEAAQALAYLGRSAVERVDALVTDADGNPLAIVGAAKGGISEAPVYPSVIVSEAFRVNGAAKIWIAHNHPSGTAELNKADRNIIGRIREAFRGSGIEASEIFAIAGAKDGGREWVYGSADPERDQRGVTSPPAAGARVPVLERLFSQEEKLGPPIGSWSVAQDVVPSLVGSEPSIVLLNNKNEPLAVVPFNPDEVLQLRKTGRMDALYRALSMANATAAFIVHDGSLSAAAGSNLAGFLNASDVVVHDIMALSGGTLTSWRASGRGNLNLKTFQQEGARGRIDFLNDGRAMITLFEGRDLSTLLHEGGHLWLEELRADARSLRSGSVFADWETVKAWMKRETGQEIRDDQPIPTEAHELWARAMERYFLEGKAPSTALRSAFASFRAWLVRIYKRVTGLNANLDDEVRQVFDRLIATDDAIRFAQSEAGDRALFGEAAAAGMTEAEFKAYQDLVSESRTEAYDKLLAKTMERVRIERTKEAKERRASIRIEVEREIRERPEWRALDLLRGNGESYMPVSKAGVVERVGRDALDLIPKGRPGKPTVSEGGLDPDLIAERAGFATGTDMLTVLTGIEIRRRELLKAGDRRSVLDEAIDVETDRRMTERYGDILSDGTIEEEALEIIHTDAGAQRLAAEVRQLAKQAGEAPTPEDAIRSWAERIVGEARIVDQASGAAVDRHRRAAEKAGRAAEQAYLNGDFAEAFRQKQRQQIANALFMASRAARERVEVIGRRLDRYAKARGFKGMAPEYLDRIHELLEQFDLRRRTEATLRERETFDRWAARQRDLGIDVQVPERLMLTGDKHFTRLTYDEVLALDDAVESLANLGRQKMRLKLDKEERDLEEMVGQAVQNAAGLPLGKFDAARNRARNVPREINAALVKIEFLADYMDDGDPNGVFNEVLVKGATRAANRLEELQREVLDPLARLYLDMPAKERRRFAERIAVPEFVSVDPETRARTPTVFMRSELIAVALNVGNKSNLEKMLQGETMAIETLLGERGAVPYAWTEEKVMAVLNRHLSESDWQFVETVWQRVNSLWPAIVEAERELTGMTPEKVEGRPVETRFGTIEGGYYPLVYDPNRSQMAANNADQEAADIFGSIGRFVGTPKGHTISRTTAALPITFSLERVLFSHVKKVSTRIAYGRYVRDVMKFAGHPKIRKLFGDTIGMEYHGQIKPWLKEQIQDASMDLKHLAALDRILRQFRINMTLVGLGFRFTTMLAQISGWHNSQAEIGTKWLARGVREMARNAGSIRSFVFEKSPELAGRAQAFDRDVRQFYQQASEGARLEGDGLLDRSARVGAAIGIDKFRAAAFWGIGMIDVYMVAMPTWLGAFHKALEERNMSEAEAIAFADKAVRKSQSAGRAKDLAAVQRGPEGIRVLTTFYSYFNVLYNKQFETLTLVQRGNEAGRAGDKAMKFAHWRQAAMNVWWIMLLAPVTSALLTGDIPEEDDRDLEGWTAWALNRIFFGLWAGVPGIRDVASKAQREISGKFSGEVQSPFFTAFDAAERPIKDLLAVLQGDEPSERWIKNAIVAPGYFLGLPTGQIGTTAQYLADVAEGDQNPEGAGDIVKGVIKGPQESQE